MKHGRLSYLGVVVLGMSIGVLLAAVMPAAAQEDATLDQPDVGGIFWGQEEEPIIMPSTTAILFPDDYTPEPPVLVSAEVDESPVCETVRLYYMRGIEKTDKTDTLQALLATIQKNVAPNVNVVVTLSPALLVVLSGPRSQVDDLKRVIAAIDVPQPQVRLDLWAFQISGSDAEVVARRAREVRRLAETVGDLMRGYLRQLEACAWASQQRNQEIAQAHGLVGLTELLAEWPSSTKAAVATVDWGKLQPGQPTILITPSDRGLHPLSLTETLATLLMMLPAKGLSWRQTLEQQLSQSLGRWLDKLAREDPAALTVWHDLVDAAPTERAIELSTLLDSTIMPLQEGADDSQEASITLLLPKTLLRTFDDAAYLKVTQQTIGNFAVDAQKQADDWRELPPDRLSRRAADVDVVLQVGERALAADIKAIFLRPLLERLRTIAGSTRPSGLAFTSSATIVVLAGTKATVTGNATSYFELNAPPEEQTAAVGHTELPVIPLLGLAESLLTEDEPRIWRSITEGTTLSFTPKILPGGAAAELDVTVDITHTNANVTVEGGAESTTAPLNCVAKHLATTTVYVNALDLFSLSSMMLRTTHPRAKSSVPVLGKLPLLGQIFEIERGPLIVHHESVLLVYSTILPTGQDLGAVFDFPAVSTAAP